MKPIIHRSCLLVCATVALVATVHTRPALTQEPRHRIANFRAANVSTAELRVTVDYTFAGAEGDTEVTIQAHPEDSAGAFDPRLVETEEVPVRPGTQTAAMSITKRTGEPEFTSVAVSVCIATSETALLCETFPHTKTWSDVATPRPEDADVPDVSDYSGYWVRSTPQQNYIVHLTVRPVSHTRMSVLAWGRCDRRPEEGGTRADCEYWAGTEVTPTPTGTASIFLPTLQERWDLRLSSDRRRLNVKVSGGTGWTSDPGIDLELRTFPSRDFCTVRGRFHGTERQLANLLSFRVPSSGSEVRRERVSGAFSFSVVEGTYVLAPAATGNRYVISNPRERRIRCRAGETLQIAFDIADVRG